MEMAVNPELKVEGLRPLTLILICLGLILDILLNGCAVLLPPRNMSARSIPVDTSKYSIDANFSYYDLSIDGNSGGYVYSSKDIHRDIIFPLFPLSLKRGLIKNTELEVSLDKASMKYQFFGNNQSPKTVAGAIVYELWPCTLRYPLWASSLAFPITVPVNERLDFTFGARIGNRLKVLADVGEISPEYKYVDAFTGIGFDYPDNGSPQFGLLARFPIKRTQIYHEGSSEVKISLNKAILYFTFSFYLKIINLFNLTK